MRAPSTENIEATRARIERGRYLAHHVTDCIGCHSDRLTTYAFPIKPGTEGRGGFPFDKDLGVPGLVSAQNITPDKATGIGAWTDGEILRAVREGIKRDGTALFPMMPYTTYHKMSHEDARSVVAYLRTLKPLRNQVPPRKIDFPVNLLIKFAPAPVEGVVPQPHPSNRLAYGKYLAFMGGCHECHSPHDDRGQIIPGRDFAGGWDLKAPGVRNVTANITPHAATYVGRATRDEFIARFKSFASLTAATAPPASPGRNTIMPWIAFSGMTEEDLGAIYDYLRTVPPVDHQVMAFPDAVRSKASR